MTTVSPMLVAGLLLAAGERLRALDLPCPTVAQVIAATGEAPLALLLDNKPSNQAS